MSIHFNRHDHNLAAIRLEAKLTNPHRTTRYQYRIYGLKNVSTESPLCDNYPVEIEAGNDVARSLVNELIAFFASNHLSIRAGDANDDWPGYSDYSVYIGLRRDLRENVPFAARVLSTIIQRMEGRLKIDDAFRLPPVPVKDERESVLLARSMRLLRVY